MSVFSLRRMSVIASVMTLSILTSACAPQIGTPDGAASGAPQADTVLGLTYIPNIQFSPTYIAVDEGMYFSAGAQLDVRHHGSDEGLFTALLTGEEDVVLASGDEALLARAQGMDLISVGTYFQKNPVVMIVPADSNIQSLAQLRGRTIGIPGEYGSSWIGLQALLNSVGLSVSDVEVTSIGYTQLAALSSGQVDAVVGFSNNEAVTFPAAGFAIRTLAAEDVPLVSASLVTTVQNFENNPEKICAIVLGTQAGMRRAVDIPQRALEATQQRDETLKVAQNVIAARQVLQATSSLFADVNGQVSARPDVDQWKKMIDFMSSSMNVTGVTVEDVVSARCWE